MDRSLKSLFSPRRLVSFVVVNIPLVVTFFWIFAEDNHPTGNEYERFVFLTICFVLIAAWVHFDKKGEWQ